MKYSDENGMNFCVTQFIIDTMITRLAMTCFTELSFAFGYLQIGSGCG